MNAQKELVKEIGSLKIELLQLLRKHSPFQKEYNNLIQLERKEGRKVLNNIK